MGNAGLYQAMVAVMVNLHYDSIDIIDEPQWAMVGYKGYDGSDSKANDELMRAMMGHDSNNNTGGYDGHGHDGL